MTSKYLLTAVAIVALAGAASAGPVPRSMLGTWKLNTAKSKSPYKSGTSVVEAAAMPSRSRPIWSGGDGTAYHWTWTAKYDGKDAPITGTTPYGPAPSRR